MDHVDVAGLGIAYQRRGEGPGLVLLHGAVSDSRVWRVELESLSDTFTVVAWDAPGCGASSEPPEHFGLAEYAECLGNFIDAIDMPDAHVLGHSWGSALALALYEQRPSLVRSLVLVGGYAGWAGSLPADEVEQRVQFALSVAALLPGGFEPTSMMGLFSDVMPTDRAAELATIMADSRPAATRAMALALAGVDQRALLPHVEVPTLVMCGSDDLRSPPDVSRALHASIPRSTLTVLPGLGHECYLEAAEVFDSEVRDFLIKIAP